MKVKYLSKMQISRKSKEMKDINMTDISMFARSNLGFD